MEGAVLRCPGTDKQTHVAHLLTASESQFSSESPAAWVASGLSSNPFKKWGPAPQLNSKTSSARHGRQRQQPPWLCVGVHT